MVKIAIIGGGSRQWTPRLVSDLLLMPSLADCELVLEDVDPEPLPPMQRYSELVAEHLGATPRIRTTTDQGAALDGADFVVVTISTGGFASMRHDLEIPERYGFKQSVGDTVGPGGISRALRNVPVLVDIARDMERRCPDAWLLNITNPMTCLTRAVCRETGVKCVGLCHEIHGTTLMLERLFDVAYDAIDPTVVGVNHLPVITDLRIDGEDGLARLAKLLEAGPQDDEQREIFRQHALKFDLFRRYGALIGSGDRHIAEFSPSLLTPESDWGGRWNIFLTTIEMRELGEEWFRSKLQHWIDGTDPLPAEPSGETVAPVVDSLVTGAHRELPVNLPNTQQAPDLPPDVVVEAMGVVDGTGMRARDAVTAPPPLDEWIRRHVYSQELTVEASLTGDRDLVKTAMSMDPLAGRIDIEAVDAMVDELLAATAPWLPRFA